MAWKHVDRADLNSVDIFSFVNLKNNVIITGRVFEGSDLKTKVLVMDTEGVIRGTVDLPDWAYRSTQDELLKALYEEVDKLPGSDFNNKVFNVRNENYTPEQYEQLTSRLTAIAFEPVQSIILKYIPDLSINDSMLDAFKF